MQSTHTDITPAAEAQAIQAALLLVTTTPAPAAPDASVAEKAQQVGTVAAVLLASLRAESERLMEQLERQAVERGERTESWLLERLQTRKRKELAEPKPCVRRYPVMS